jgi:hypothetical protein
MESNRFIDNLLSLHAASGATIREEGLAWYGFANSVARRLSQDYFLPSLVSHASGIIAVLSPAVQWEVNLRDAETVCAARKGDDVTVSTYGPQKAKAFAIRDGVSPVRMINPKTAPKTYAFWRCIQSPRNTKHVVIDRHALAACHGHVLNDRERGLELRRVGRYGFYSDCYREAAKQVGILPLQMQAICWTKWRQDHA